MLGRMSEHLFVEVHIAVILGRYFDFIQQAAYLVVRVGVGKRKVHGAVFAEHELEGKIHVLFFPCLQIRSKRYGYLYWLGNASVVGLTLQPIYGPIVTALPILRRHFGYLKESVEKVYSANMESDSALCEASNPKMEERLVAAEDGWMVVPRSQFVLAL